MEIGIIIKKLRQKHNITQEELGLALNVSTQAVSKWECGGMPDIELLPKIADFFNVTIDYLFDRQINKYDEQSVENIIQNLCNYIFEINEEIDAFNKIYEICFYMFKSVFNKVDMGKENFKELFNEYGINGLHTCKGGISCLSLNTHKPFFAIFPTPINHNWNILLETKEIQLDFVKYLSNKDFYNTLIFLNTRKNKNFTEELLIKELSISLDNADQIIERLLKYRLLNKTELEIDNKIIKTYSLINSEYLIGLLSFLDFLVTTPKPYNYYIHNKDGEYFKKN